MYLHSSSVRYQLLSNQYRLGFPLSLYTVTPRHTDYPVSMSLSKNTGDVDLLIDMRPTPLASAWLGLWLLLRAPASFEKCIFDDVQSLVKVVAPPPWTVLDTPTSSGAVTPVTAPKSVPPYHRALPARKPPSPARKRTYRQLVPPTQTPIHSGWPAPLPIRIKTWILKESPALSQMERERLEPAVNEAVSTVSSILSVNRVPGPLLLSRDINKYCKFIWRNSSTANYNRCGRANEHYRTETCLDVIIPDEHLSGCAIYPEPNSPTMTVLRPEGAGLPETDFLLYLHTQSTDKCLTEASVLAYAVHCQTDRQGRPLAGVVVICREHLSRERFHHQSTVQMLVHELFHALGFSKELFNTWRDCSHSTHTGLSCSPRGQVTNTDEAGQMRIYTPSVISALQEHLRSTDPQLGGLLENLGGRGLSSHWEARVLQGSIMAALLGDRALVRIDPVTLAALQDTGWYSVNHSNAQPLEWGEGQGALFGSLSTCRDNSSSFFCTGSGSGCHYLHLHKGECQSDEYLEGCCIYKPLTNGSECWREENERVSGTDEWSGEIYGSDSRCFFSNLSKENLSPSLSVRVVGRCYKHRCTGLNQYQIHVSSSDWVDCPAGVAIQVPGYRGLVLCPDRRLCRHSQSDPPTNNQAPPLPPGPTPSSSPIESAQSFTRHHVTPAPDLTFDPGPSSTVFVRGTPPIVASVLGAWLFSLSWQFSRWPTGGSVPPGSGCMLLQGTGTQIRSLLYSSSTAAETGLQTHIH
ncbi:hypothetical protein SKAU_G00288750 [Synaphobranchus kaupii]|uniref:Leishmanolysin-like peptidase n=1 Tax=Synaphobranchus kaupii TaxID=118154 RepID=A0A9Q1IL41_SYNKA|nr:hypothetical protein SKAU_G00288750 [Synaphobranchus kaupii]